MTSVYLTQNGWKLLDNGLWKHFWFTKPMTTTQALRITKNWKTNALH